MTKKKSFEFSEVIRGPSTAQTNHWTDNNIKLTCSAQGENQTQISWYKDWVPLKAGLQDEGMAQGEDHNISTNNPRRTVP